MATQIIWDWRELCIRCERCIRRLRCNFFIYCPISGKKASRILSISFWWASSRQNTRKTSKASTSLTFANSNFKKVKHSCYLQNSDIINRKNCHSGDSADSSLLNVGWRPFYLVTQTLSCMKLAFCTSLYSVTVVKKQYKEKLIQV